MMEDENQEMCEKKKMFEEGKLMIYMHGLRAYCHIHYDEKEALGPCWAMEIFNRFCADNDVSLADRVALSNIIHEEAKMKKEKMMNKGDE